MFQDSCIYSLLHDYIMAGGICKDTQFATNGYPNFERFPAAWPTSTNPVCTTSLAFNGTCYSERDMKNYPCSFYDITSGVCSADTVTLLGTSECQNEFSEQPSFIYTTLSSLLHSMCTNTDIPFALGGSGRKRRRPALKKKKNNKKNKKRPQSQRPGQIGRNALSNSTNSVAPVQFVAPIQFVDTTSSGEPLFTKLNPGNSNEVFCGKAN